MAENIPLPIKKPARPLVNSANLREYFVVNDLQSIFRVDDDSEARSRSPIYEFPYLATKKVRQYDYLIGEMADIHDVDKNLIRAIMWAENARGARFGFDYVTDSLGLSDRIMPMNIDKNKWSALLGGKRRNLYDTQNNIEAGTILIKRLVDRTENPAPEKIGSLWNFIGNEKVTDFGAYVGKIYEDEPWKKYK